MKVFSLRRTLAFAAASLMFGSLSLFADSTPPLFRYRPPSVVSTVPAVYPINSVAWGTVILELSLGRDGSIGHIRVIHGIPSLTSQAIAAAQRWKFAPAELNGRAIRSKLPVAFTFVPPGVGPRI